MQDAGLTVTSQSNKQIASVDLKVDDSGSQTWSKTSGLLNIGGTGGVWRLGGWQDSSSRVLAMYAGPDYDMAKLVVALNKVPAQFIGAFCVSYTGDGYLAAGADAFIGNITYEIDVNPCS